MMIIYHLYPFDLMYLQIRTIIGHGSSKEGTGGVHGAPLGASDLIAVKKKFGFDPSQVTGDDDNDNDTDGDDNDVDDNGYDNNDDGSSYDNDDNSYDDDNDNGQ